MRTDKADAGTNIKSLVSTLKLLSAAIVLFLDEPPAGLSEPSRGSGKALKCQRQKRRDPCPSLLLFLLPANSNEADCQSGSIVSTVNPVVWLLNTQGIQTKASMNLFIQLKITVRCL